MRQPGDKTVHVAEKEFCVNLQGRTLDWKTGTILRLEARLDILPDGPCFLFREKLMKGRPHNSVLGARLFAGVQGRQVHMFYDELREVPPMIYWVRGSVPRPELVALHRASRRSRLRGSPTGY